MVQVIIFSGKKDEDAIAHLQNFVKIGNTINIQGIPQDVVLLRLFPYSLEGRAKHWFYESKNQFKTWRECSKAFLEKFFPIGRTNILRGKISEFHQQKGEPIPEAWERFQGYISDCPASWNEEVVAHADILLWTNLKVM